MISDSGERTEFEVDGVKTGAVRDMHAGKGRFDLTPMLEMCELIGFGSEGREDPLLYLWNFANSAKGGAVHAPVLYQAIWCFLREREWDVSTAMLEMAVHFEQGAEKYGPNNWTKGISASSYLDSAVRHYLKWMRGDDDERHDRAFLWNALCLLWTLRNRPECNNLGDLEAI